MKFLIMPKPILAKNMSLRAYCLRYQQAQDFVADAPVRFLDGIVALPFLKVLDDLGLDALTGGSPLFVPINKFSLLTDISEQCHQPPNKIIFLLDNQVPPEEPFLSCIKNLKSKGFSFAVENVVNFGFMDPILQHCDYVMLSFKAGNMKNLDLYTRMSFKYKDHIFIASGVDRVDTFYELQKHGFRFYEGNFYTLPLPRDRGAMSPVKVNRIQLLNTVHKPDFAIEDVVKIVTRDPSMIISLLRFVNSPYLGISQEIKSVPQAVALLGQVEVRKWVLTTIMSLLAEDKPSELVRLALFRAKFAERLARCFDMAMLSNTLFLVGLFSILDATLDLPMEEALQKVKVSDEVSSTLITREGRLAPVLNFVFAYESADWTGVKNIMILNKIKPEEIFEAYIDTAKWYGSLIDSTKETVDQP
ncbi:MAG: HDOD domain-containing protein [Clostridiales bacterium]|jgi:EAL and modified HD-GYP domain-containing signal transduction protein|nr:HDOD domain-containing protein [Clostridiales bacterium]